MQRDAFFVGTLVTLGSPYAQLSLSTAEMMGIEKFATACMRPRFLHPDLGCRGLATPRLQVPNGWVLGVLGIQFRV